MSEAPEKSSKTEEPTEKKVRDAIEKGNIPFSKEAGTLASLLAVLFFISFLLIGEIRQLTASMSRFLESPAAWSLGNYSDAVALFGEVASDMFRVLMPAVLVLAVAGIASSILQNPPRIVVERIRPELSRLSLTKGWSRLFGKWGQVEFLKAIFKFAMLGVLGYLMLKAGQRGIESAILMEPGAIPELILSMTSRMLSIVIVATILLVAADLVWSRDYWYGELRMTRQEVKDEHKQVDGDPIVKSRLRSLAKDRLRRRMIASVPKATLVIANPTHFAVALRYVRQEGGAPLVIAKGQDLIALKIREIAEQHGIPIVEDKVLARSLYKAVEVDRMIPPEFYKAVAEIVIYLSARGLQGSFAR